MSRNLYDAMVSIQKMPYYKNESAKSGIFISGHENAVASKLSNAGFIEEKKDQFPKLGKNILKEWTETGDDSIIVECISDMKNGSYIVQPAGSQGFPDIILKDFDGRIIAIECKSTKHGCPMWNDNIPKPNVIYVFSSAKYDETTIFMGRDVISSVEYKILIEQQKQYAIIDEIFRKKMNKADIYKRGWNKKVRPQHSQMGGKNKTDYFIHEDREFCEYNVLSYTLECEK